MTLIFKLVQGGYCNRFCLYRCPEIHLHLFAINQWSDYSGRKTEHHWCSIDAHFKVLYSQFQLALIILETIISTQLLPFWAIGNKPIRKAEPRNILVWASLIQPKLIQLFKYCNSPAIVFFTNKYPHASAHYYSVIYPKLKFSVNQHIEPDENILTQSVLVFLVSLIPPCFRCTDRHWPLFSLFH